MSQNATSPQGSSAVEGAQCVVCGYSLSGLDPRGLCPECGTPVERSVSNDLLIHSASDYIETLRRGAFVVLAAIVLQLLSMVVSVIWAVGLSVTSGGQAPAAGSAAPGLSFNIIWTLLSLASLLGWWWLSAPDPSIASRYRGDAPRQWVRGSVIAQAALTLLSTLGLLWGASGSSNAAMIGGGVSILAGLLNFVALAIWFFASMMYLRWLAPRLPNRRVFARAKTMMWLGPLLVTVGALCLYIGPLVALVLYWNMIYWVWKDLGQILERQRGLA